MNLSFSKKLCARVIFLILFTMIANGSFSQKKDLTWEELREQYEIPKWFAEARFGIWAHWGAQSVPLMGGGWYAKHMYMQNVGTEWFGENAYPYHNKTYGHPSEFGFKDVINEWKAQNLDTDELMKYFKGLGAKYFVVLASHHDHFDNFNSTYHPWNSVNVGPKRDIVGEFKKSAKKYGLPFGVSVHDVVFPNWWNAAFGSDATGPKKGVSYDVYLKKEDGKGKWWEGLDPVLLYGLPPAKRTPEWLKQVKETWVLRQKELAIKYDVDMLWFDFKGFPYGEYGKDVCWAYYNYSLQKNGKIMGIVAGKIPNESSIVKDVERGSVKDILPDPWQATVTFSKWFYKEDKPLKHNARTVIEMMSDIISKNGNLLLNVELFPDGTVPPKHKVILDSIGSWVNLNSKAIYASKPWKFYGDNLHTRLKAMDATSAGEATADDSKKQAVEENFTERTVDSPPFGHDEVRFTTKGNVLYIFVLNPVEGFIELSSLGLKSTREPHRISSITMLGGKEKVSFKQDYDKLRLNIPGKRSNKFATVFEVKGAL